MTEKIQNKPSRAESIHQRRELILETAVDCFVLKGFHQTSIRDIANKAGISLGGFYNHFESKDALIEEIAVLEANELTEFEAGLLSAGDPASALKRFSDEYLDYSQQPVSAVLTAQITAEAIRNPQIGKRFMTNRQRLAKAILNLLTKGVGQEQFAQSASNIEVAGLLLDLIEGLALRSAFSGRKTSSASRKALHNMVQKIVNP